MTMAGTFDTDKSQPTLSQVLETDFLKCKLCNSVFTDPRLLPCLHTFCHACIGKHVQTRNQSKKVTSSQQSGQSQSSLQNTDSLSNGVSHFKEADELEDCFPCPICKSDTTIVTDNGKTSFSEDIFTQSLCLMYGYKTGKNRHCEYCKFDGKVVGATHLCLDCQDNMCQTCTGAHHRTKVTRGHKVIPYTEVQKGDHDLDIRSFQGQICKLHSDEALIIFCEKCELLICKACKVAVHDDHKWLSAEKAIPKYHTQIKNLLKGLQQQIPSIHKYIQFLSNYDDSIEINREKVKMNINEQASILHKLVEDHKLACIEALNQESDKERCQLQVKSLNLKTAAGSLENNETYLRLLLHHGKPDEILSLHHEINKRMTQLACSQLDGMENQLKADFKSGDAIAKNIHIVFGTLNVSHQPFRDSDNGLASSAALRISSILPNIKNCPDQLLQFDATGSADTKEVWPTGIAVTDSNEYVVIDRDNKKLKIYTQTGKLKREITGEGKNKLAIPFAVAVTTSGDIVVSDHDAEAVKIFTAAGEHVISITEGIKYPRGVAVNSKGQIITVDCHNRYLTVHDPRTGKLVRTIEGKDRKGSKVLVDPYYVAVTAQDTLVVTDTAAPHSKFFSSTGEYLATYGNYGVRKDQMLQPYGICRDSYGYIFVADNQNHRIHVLLPDGKFSQFLVTKADGLWHPMGLSVVETGSLVVTEALGKVKVFKYL